MLVNNNRESTGTGFIGKMKFEDETESTVLVTCFHVIIEESHGLSDIEAQDIDENTRTRIEKHAKRFKIISTPKSVELSDILEGSCKVSPRSSVCFFKILCACTAFVYSCIQSIYMYCAIVCYAVTVVVMKAVHLLYSCMYVQCSSFYIFVCVIIHVHMVRKAVHCHLKFVHCSTLA